MSAHSHRLSGEVLLGGAAVLFSAALLAARALAALARPVDLYDECLPLVHARLLRQGAEPFGDFFMMYPALPDRLLAWIFGWTGESVLAVRFFYLAVTAVLTAGVFLFFRAREGSALRAAAWTALFLAATGAHFERPSWPWFAAALGSVLCYVTAAPEEKGRTGPARAALACAGALAGLAFCGRVGFGLYALAACLLAEISARRARGAALLAVSFAVPAAFVFAGAGSLREAFLWNFIHPLLHVAPLRFVTPPPEAAAWIAFPFLWWVLRERAAGPAAGLAALFGAAAFTLAGSPAERWVPALSPLVAGAILFLWHRAGERGRETDLALLLFHAFFLNYYLYRADAPHGYPLGVSAVFLALTFVPRGAALPGPVLVAAAVLVTAVSTAPPVLARDAARGLRSVRQIGALLRSGDAAALESGRPPLVRELYPDPREHDAVRAARSLTRPDEAVYVGLLDHSRGFVPNVRVTWLLDRPPGARTLIFDPGFADTEAFERLTARDLEERNVSTLLLWKGAQKDADFWRRDHKGSEYLDRAIRRRYRRAGFFGEDFEIFRVHAAAQGALQRYAEDVK